MSDSMAQRAKYVHLGMDVHRDWISTGVLRPGGDEVDVDKVFHDEPSVRRFVRQLGEPGRVWACYEAGPTGYGLARLLESMGVRCDVIAPSLIPTTPGDRVKTDRRDCRKLARLHRAGELTAIPVPTPREEAVRDLCRARADAVKDLRRARQRLGMFLLRHGRVWRDGKGWTHKHWRWVRAQRFDEPALATTFAHYLGVVEGREATLGAIDGELAGWFDRDPFGETVSRLAAYRGITELGGLVLASEVGDWRRFATAGMFMGSVGLVPSEYSSGGSVSRGSITKTGNQHARDQLVEAAWAYQHRPAVGAALQRRQQRCRPQTVARSWKAQQRLCTRFRHLAARKHVKTVVATAIARELAGFVWAEMTADD